MEGLGFRLRREAGLSMLTTEVVTTSAIEGELLNPDEVRSSIARRLGLETAGLPKAGRDVEAIVEVMLDATHRFAEPLTTERLFSWHAALFPTGRSGMTRINVGGWRQQAGEPMQVVSGPMGREKVHFQAPESTRVVDEMTRFLEWFNSKDPLDPVLKAGLAHLWFVTVHPFDDGNGPVARAMADMALARADGSSDRFYSMSAQLDAERKVYYEVLERTQRAGLDLTDWLIWFLACLDRALESAERSLSTVIHKARFWQQIGGHALNARQRGVVTRMLSGFEGFLTTSKYAKLAECSSDTALRDIQELLQLGILARNEGRARATSYRLADLQPQA